MRINARVVVEGMDGSGKTSLVNKILSGLGSDTSYLVRNDRGPDRDLRTFWLDSLGDNPVGRVAVHDRFFYPEVIYGPILRNKISVEGGTIEYVSKYLRNFAYLIYCRPPTSIIAAGVQVEEQWPGVRENFIRLLDQYDDTMMMESQWYQDRFLRFDWTADEAEAELLVSLARYLG